jgi:epoxyqueuosine reductase QueG
MGHQVLSAIEAESFTPLGWFDPEPVDGVPPLAGGAPAASAVLVGNAGPAMFARFAAERDPACNRLDDWCRDVLGRLAAGLGAGIHYPFDSPPLPFSTWARRANCGHASPLGLNIHPRYGLWQAYRALVTFEAPLGIAAPEPGPHPCRSCRGRPCLSACPVGAFTDPGYNVEACARHIGSNDGAECMTGGCLARRACPVGRAYAYEPRQARFHMTAFLAARSHS